MKYLNADELEIVTVVVFFFVIRLKTKQKKAKQTKGKRLVPHKEDSRGSRSSGGEEWRVN